MAPVSALNSVVEWSNNKIDPTIQKLVEESVSARKRAHSPYSRFSVGAALLCKDGTVFQGCNVENISLGLTICAERTAVVKAVSEGYNEAFEAVAVTGVLKDTFTTPCGACRQFLAEFNPRMKVYLFNPSMEKVALTSLEELLPSAFSPESVTLDMS